MDGVRANRIHNDIHIEINGNWAIGFPRYFIQISVTVTLRVLCFSCFGIYAAAKVAPRRIGEASGDVHPLYAATLIMCEIVISSEQPMCEAHDLPAVLSMFGSFSECLSQCLTNRMASYLISLSLGEDHHEDWPRTHEEKLFVMIELLLQDWGLLSSLHRESCSERRPEPLALAPGLRRISNKVRPPSRSSK